MTASNVRQGHLASYVIGAITLLVLFIVVDGIGHLIIRDPFLRLGNPRMAACD